MTDKVQKIREEVERLMNDLIQEKEKGFGSDTDDACILELQNVLTYIDSLSEEPIIIDAPSYDYVKGFSDGRLYEKKQKEEPVSEDLKEAADNALNNVLNTHEIVNVRSCLEMFRFGAKWQEKQDQETIELAEDHAMLAGIVKGKEEAIKKTIDFLNWIIGTGNSTIEEYKKYMNN